MSGSDIVTVSVKQLVAPTPSTLQKTGCVVSQGATTLAAGKYSLLTQASDLSAVLKGAIAVSTMVLSTGTVTVTLSAPHGIPTSDMVQGTIAGVTPSAYNGTFAVTSTGANTFTYPLGGTPGSVSVQGSFTLEDVAEVAADVTTFFAQGSAAALYVLEFGPGTPAEGVAALTTYLNAPALTFYAYRWPDSWDTEATAATLASQYTAPDKKTYFLVNTTLATYTPWKALKSVVAFVQNAAAPTSESDPAFFLYNILQTNPSSTAKLTPFAFRFAFGVTALNPTGPDAVTLRANFLNYIDTGAEGGITNTLVKFGTTMDGRDFAYWYAADYVQINSKIVLAAAVINGNNNPTNPLYYNQPGINTLQQVEQGLMSRCVSFGVAAGSPIVTAVSFKDYTTQNPSDYVNGIYNGLACTFTPQTGFKAITFNLVVSDLAAP